MDARNPSSVLDALMLEGIPRRPPPPRSRDPQARISAAELRAVLDESEAWDRRHREDRR